MANDLLINIILNDNCLLEIFSYLTPLDILHVQQVCNRWDELCQGTWKSVVTLSYSCGRWCFRREDNRRDCNCPLNDALSILNRVTPFIHHCNLSIVQGKFPRTILKVTKNSNNFKEYNITIPDLLVEKSINVLLSNCVNLETLTIEDFSGDVERDLPIFLSRNTQLKFFSLGSMKHQSYVVGEMFEYLPADLKRIHLCRIGMDSSWFVISALLRTNRLRSFKYDFPHSPQDSIANIIGDKTTLTSLSMRNLCGLSSSFNCLANLVNLEELNLSYNKYLEDDSLINILDSCKQLKKLDISGCDQLTDHGMAEIAELTQLESLTLNFLSKMTDKPIGNLPNTLKYLSCRSCTRINDHGVITLINRAPSITSLNLTKCNEITNRLLTEATKAVQSRTNKITLQIRVAGSGVTKSRKIVSRAINIIHTDDYEYEYPEEPDYDQYSHITNRRYDCCRVYGYAD